ncbi:signal peptidase II [Candidatus Reidiella endopervernicosa]|uniref:signal peptidase II n=1 Tax=Candidatus Reidiella endopervernicosa TaxID=2738883 RepID=UPI002A4E2128|nr:signal peptidase II [Candidatus Reidiella endopervernicosa]
MSGIIILLDQLSKWWIERSFELYESLSLTPFFNLTLVYNEGAAFSFLSTAGGWQRWFFVVLGVVITTVLLTWMHRSRADERLLRFALALVVGGAIGNIIDRLLYGHVIDFLDFYINDWHWPAFNVADSAIFVGVVLLMLDSLRDSRRN